MKKAQNLSNLIDYITKQNPRGVQKLGNSYGELPYNYREPIKNYLKKVCLNIVKNEGIDALLMAHPDRNLFKMQFESEFVNTQNNDKLTTSKEEKAVSEPQTITENTFNHFKQVPFSRFTSPHNDYSNSNFFGEQQNKENQSTKVAFWASGIVVLIMLSFFFMHLLTKKTL